MENEAIVEGLKQLRKTVAVARWWAGWQEAVTLLDAAVTALDSQQQATGTTHEHPELRLNVVTYRSTRDSAAVVEIETTEGTERVRVLINEGVIFDQDPEHHGPWSAQARLATDPDTSQPAGTAPGETMSTDQIIGLIREHHETAIAYGLAHDTNQRRGWQSRAAALREVLESIDGTPEADAVRARREGDDD